MNDLLELKVLERSYMNKRATISQVSTRNGRNIKVPEEQVHTRQEKKRSPKDKRRLIK
jgi:hypothetical protein